MDGKVFVCIVFAVFVMTYQTVHGRSLEDPLLTYRLSNLLTTDPDLNALLLSLAANDAEQLQALSAQRAYSKLPAAVTDWLIKKSASGGGAPNGLKSDTIRQWYLGK